MDLIYIDPPFNSNRNYEVFWGETKEKRASLEVYQHSLESVDKAYQDAVQTAGI